MPTAHTLETICNAALDIIGERPVASLMDNRAEVRWFVRNYTHYVQTALRQNIWNFATELWQLNRDVSDPAFRWRYRYGLPNGWLRVLPVTYDGWRTGQRVPYEVKSNYVYTDWLADAGMNVELVMDRQNPGEWDPLFANVIAARLAHGMAHSLTHKTSFVQLAKQAAAEAYEVAEQVNAFEGDTPPTEQHDIIRVRGL